MKNLFTILILVAFFSGCTENQTTQVAENTFVYNSKIYKIVDNELTIIGDLNSDSIRKFQVHQPVKREFGECTLDFVKPNSHTELNALYRGNSLYFNFYLLGLNDLKEEYEPGLFSIYFQDEFGFIIHTTEVTTSELMGIVGEDNKTIQVFSYNGKTELSSDIYKAIKSYTVSSTVKLKIKTSWNW